MNDDIRSDLTEISDMLTTVLRRLRNESNDTSTIHTIESSLRDLEELAAHFPRSWVRVSEGWPHPLEPCLTRYHGDGETVVVKTSTGVWLEVGSGRPVKEPKYVIPWAWLPEWPSEE